MAYGRTMTAWQRLTTTRKLLVLVPVVTLLLVVRWRIGDQWDLVNLAMLGVVLAIVLIRGPEWARMFVLSVGVAATACGLIILGIIALG